MKKLVFAVVAACGVFGFAKAEDLTVEKGATTSLTESATYDTVTVHGMLTIEKGVKLTATTLELGPDEGDAAVVNVLRSDATGLKATTVNVGSNGGTGKIVALSPEATHNTGWDSVCVLSFNDFTVTASAAVDNDGFVDVVQLGPGTVDIKTFYNKSSGRARILVKNGSIGYAQNWSKTIFSGAWQLESFDDGAIRVGVPYSCRYLNDASLIIKGHGKDLYINRYLDPAATQHTILSSGVVYDGVRKLQVVERHHVTLTGSNLLPYGAGTEGVVLATVESYIKMGSTTQRMSSFSSARTTAALQGDVGGKVIFGEGDTAGSLKGIIEDTLAVYKVGTGTFDVANPSSVGALTVSGGTFRVSAALTVASIFVAPDATLEIDGVTVAPSTGVADVRGYLVLKNGGRLVSNREVAADERVIGYANGGLWEKTGDGRCILENPENMPSNVHVKAGAVSFSAGGYVCDLYKWNVTGWSNAGWLDRDNGFEDNMFYLGELAFVAPNGDRIGAGAMSSAAIGTDPGDLAAGKCCFAAGTTLMTKGGHGDAGSLFDKNQYPRVGVASPLTTDEGGVTAYFRLPDGSPAVSAINFAGAYGGFPKTWTLSASRDGGQTWTVLNEQSGYKVADSDSSKWMGTAKAGYGNPVPKECPLYSADMSWTHAGTQGMPATMQVEVDADAELDFSNVTGGQSIDRLTVDAKNGGGTVRNAKFAGEGVIELLNVPAETKLTALSIPLTLVDAESLPNLRSWQIVVGGVQQKPGKFRAVYKDGALTFSCRGLNPSVRNRHGGTKATPDIPADVSVERANLANYAGRDHLGRSLVSFAETGTVKPFRQVGLFYYLWLGQHGTQGPYDVSKIEAADSKAMEKPDSPLWPNPTHAPMLHWGEPLFGYYQSTDEWVLRRHVQMFIDAGIDVLYFDTTNGYHYREVTDRLFAILQEYHDKGFKVPKFCYYMAPGRRGCGTSNVLDVWNSYYRDGKYSDLYFKWDGKPLIITHVDRPYRQEILDFFTFRKPTWCTPSVPDTWYWGGMPTQNVAVASSGRREMLPVTVQTPHAGMDAPDPKVRGAGLGCSEAYWGAPIQGRSWHDGRRDDSPHAVEKGLFFQGQIDWALDKSRKDVPLAFVCQWNEWIVPFLTEKTNDLYDMPHWIKLQDEYNMEYSRDIEPMKGGYHDAYYWQLMNFVRCWKGLPTPVKGFTQYAPAAAGDETWKHVSPLFIEMTGDGAPRNHPGYDACGVYTNATVENEFVALRVAVGTDGKVRFWARTVKPVRITSLRSMNLFVRVSGAPVDGLGYTHRLTPNDPDVSKSAYEFVYAVEASRLGIDSTKPFSLEFKWSDNRQEETVDDFYVNGDAAPRGRVNWRFDYEPWK